jgi:hypothetical protein
VHYGSHLTALGSLEWSHFGDGLTAPDLTLPSQPIQLSSTGKLQLVGPFNLPHVELEARTNGCGCEVLLQLPVGPHTRYLEISLLDAEVLSRELCQMLGAALGALTNLTSLVFTSDGCLTRLRHVQLLQQLRKLPSLVELSLGCIGPRVECVGEDGGAVGMLQLSTLTGLTSLQVLDYATGELDDVVAAAVALSLTRLQEAHQQQHGDVGRLARHSLADRPTQPPIEGR